MEKEESTAVRMEVPTTATSVIIKTKTMKENNKRQSPDTNRSNDEGRAAEELTGKVIQEGSANVGSASALDEKSSTMSRRDKGTGLATKDGVTGSDFDGQLSE